MQDTVPSSSSLPPSLRLAVVGTGALGSEVCRLLLHGAHREVLLVDPDRVHPQNVPLSRIFQQADTVGRSKVAVIAETARTQGLGWQTMETEIADAGLAVLRGFDLLLSCTDSALARVETAFAARSLRLPMLDAGVQSHGIAEGRVSCFAAADDAACYLCGFSETRRAELLSVALSASLGCHLPEDAALPMTGAPAAVDSTAQALLGLVAEAAHTPPRTSFARRLRLGEPAERIELGRSPSCPWHTLALPDTLAELPSGQPIRTLLAPDEVLELGWPVCLRARCGQCFASCEPFRRTAFVRRTLPCPGCGRGGVLDPLESVQTLSRTHPLAGRTLLQLGLPERQLYRVRREMLAVGPGPL